MAKQSGLGDNFYWVGRDLSGDVGSLGSISGGNAPIEVTGISSSAMERLGGIRNGQIEFNAFFNDATSPDGAFSALKGLSTSDRTCSYFRGTAIGNAAAGLVAKQINLDPTRGADGSLTLAIQAVSNGFGLEWGVQLTAGMRTDTVATNGTSYDTGGSLAFGAQVYLHVSAFSGTDVTVTIQDSANDSLFADVASLSSSSITSAPTASRFFTTNTATIRRYLRAVTTTSAGFTSVSFAVMVVKNATAGIVF